MRIMILKKLDSCWEAFLSTGGTVTRSGDAEGAYGRGIVLLVDPLAFTLFTCSYARKPAYVCSYKRKLEEVLRK